MRTSIKKERTVSTKRTASKKTVAIEVYREIISPSQKRISITLPRTLVGKTVEVLAFELHTPAQANPAVKRVSKNDFWETFGSGKDSSISIEAIRQQAWRKY